MRVLAGIQSLVGLRVCRHLRLHPSIHPSMPCLYGCGVLCTLRCLSISLSACSLSTYLPVHRLRPYLQTAVGHLCPAPPCPPPVAPHRRLHVTADSHVGFILGSRQLYGSDAYAGPFLCLHFTATAPSDACVRAILMMRLDLFGLLPPEAWSAARTVW